LPFPGSRGRSAPFCLFGLRRSSGPPAVRPPSVFGPFGLAVLGSRGRSAPFSCRAPLFAWRFGAPRGPPGLSVPGFRGSAVLRVRRAFSRPWRGPGPPSGPPRPRLGSVRRPPPLSVPISSAGTSPTGSLFAPLASRPGAPPGSPRPRRGSVRVPPSLSARSGLPRRGLRRGAFRVKNFRSFQRPLSSSAGASSRRTSSSVAGPFRRADGARFQNILPPFRSPPGGAGGPCTRAPVRPRWGEMRFGPRFAPGAEGPFGPHISRH